MLSIRVLNLLRWTAVQACQKACRNSSTMEVGSSMPRVETPIWSQTCSLGCLCLDSELTSPWPPYPVVSKKQSCHVLYEVCHCPGQTQSFVRKRCRPGMHTIAKKPDVALAVEGSTQHHQFTPPTMRIAPHTMTEGYRPWVRCTHLSVPPSVPLKSLTIASGNVF